MFSNQKKIFRFSFFLLSILFGIFSFFIWFGLGDDLFSLSHWKIKLFPEKNWVSFSLGLKQDPLEISSPNVEGEIELLIHRKHPAMQDGSCDYFVRLKKNGALKPVFLPARIDLCYENGLQFSEKEGPFWLDLEALSDGRVSVKSFVVDLQDEKHLVGSWILKKEEIPFSKKVDQNSFSFVLNANYLGRDLVLARLQEDVYLFEVGKELFKLKEGDLLVWENDRWVQSDVVNLQSDVARVGVSSAKEMVLEGWDREGGYYRFLVPVKEEAFSLKTENFLTSLRVRSEKQLSCMLEKQCMIVHVGDWVMKGADHRWKILRSQEKQAYLQGQLRGELLIFERVDTKSGHKRVATSLFNTNHSQMVSMEWDVKGLNRERK